jgi:serine/threonine protein kinase
MGEKIGEGHFGLVYSCVDVWNNDLAAKMMKPLASYSEVKESAEAELQKLLYLRHPHITYVFDAFEYRETFYLITERCYCPLIDLLQLEDFSGLSWIKPIARCLLQAVGFIHTNGYVHQDIHLGNVFTSFVKDELGANDPGAIQFKLGDLGVAKLASEIDATNTRAQWMLPPEVLEEFEYGPIDHRLDIYHCGLLFLNLAHGHEMRFTPEEIKAGRPRELALQLPSPYSFALEKARTVSHRVCYGIMERSEFASARKSDACSRNWTFEFRGSFRHRQMTPCGVPQVSLLRHGMYPFLPSSKRPAA